MAYKNQIPISNKILITGGLGYIGCHINKALKKHGYQSVIFDNKSSPQKTYGDFAEIITGDLTNYYDIHQALQKVKPKGVIHCAAHIDVGESVKYPYKYYHNNVFGSLNLFEAMTANNLNNIVFSSTCAVYGAVKMLPILEDAPKTPISPYGKSKLMVEEILKDFNTTKQFSYAILRYFNIAGADKDLQMGEDRTPNTHLVPSIMDAVFSRKSHINVYGNDYPTKDGTCIRDYIHVEDLALAHVLALEYLLNGGKSDDFNLGTGKGYSVKEVLDTVKKVTNKKLNIKYQKRREGDPAALFADSQKAQKTFNWTIQNKDMYSIIYDSFKWEEKIAHTK